MRLCGGNIKAVIRTKLSHLVYKKTECFAIQVYIIQTLSLILKPKKVMILFVESPCTWNNA